MTTDRYDTTGNPEAEFEAGSDDSVLKNKLGIRDASELDDVELDLLMQLYDEIPEAVEADQPLTSQDIREWHHRWLGNVYPWAGLSRTVNMGKGDFQFAAAGQIDRLMEELDFSLWDEQKKRYFSAIQAGLDDYEPMKELVRLVLLDASRNADV
jgi:cell filamentation protein